MGMTIIGISLFLTVFMAFIMRIAGNPHKNIILENTLPADKINDPQVVDLANKYKRKLWQIALVFIVLALAALFLKYDSLLMTGFWIIIMGSTAAFYGCEILYIRKMHRLITENNWTPQVKPVLIDTKLIPLKNVKMVSWFWLLPPLALIIAGFLIGRHALDGIVFATLMSLFVWLIFAAGWYFIARLPVRPLTDDASVNQRYNDLTKHHWSLIVVVSSWFTAPLLLLPLVSFNKAGAGGKALIVAFVLLLLGMLIFPIYYSFDLRKKQDQLISQAAAPRYYGDDPFWRYVFYMNPDDPRLMVPNRLNTKLGINLGRTSGKIIMGLVGLLLVGAFFFSLVPVYLFDFTSDPFTMEVGHSIAIKAPLTPSADIPLTKVKSVALIEKMPNDITRTNGLSTDNYATGDFRVSGKSANLYLDRHSKPILVIKTAGRDYYYTNKEPAKTKALYQELQAKI